MTRPLCGVAEWANKLVTAVRKDDFGHLYLLPEKHPKTIHWIVLTNRAMTVDLSRG